MKVVILGAASFIGTNLALHLLNEKNVELSLVDIKKEYFHRDLLSLENIRISESLYDDNTDFDNLLEGAEVVYHLVSTTTPTVSNKCISKEITDNVGVTALLLDACVRQKVKRIVFISSGGTVYGKDAVCPINENAQTYPINAYGLQKLSIEKLLYLYNYIYGLDYRIVRLANPYGPYQRPNGKLGAVTTFIYKAITGDPIVVYGDGTVVRDYIYIEDAAKAIINIADDDTQYKLYNIGSGHGISLNELLAEIRSVLQTDPEIKYVEGRKVDVQTNYLDTGRYESEFGSITHIGMAEGIRRTESFLRKGCQ